MKKETTVVLNFSISGKDDPIVTSFEVKDGESAYHSFISIPGNEQKTIEDFFDYIRGIQGKGIVDVSLKEIMGLSAFYQIKDNGKMEWFESDESDPTFIIERADKQPFLESDLLSMVSLTNRYVWLNMEMASDEPVTSATISFRKMGGNFNALLDDNPNTLVGYYCDSESIIDNDESELKLLITEETIKDPIGTLITTLPKNFKVGEPILIEETAKLKTPDGAINDKCQYFSLEFFGHQDLLATSAFTFENKNYLYPILNKQSMPVPSFIKNSYYLNVSSRFENVDPNVSTLPILISLDANDNFYIDITAVEEYNGATAMGVNYQQYLISGKVYDKVTKAPAKGILVWGENPTSYTADVSPWSNEDGTFKALLAVNNLLTIDDTPQWENSSVFHSLLGLKLGGSLFKVDVEVKPRIYVGSARIVGVPDDQGNVDVELLVNTVEGSNVIIDGESNYVYTPPNGSQTTIPYVENTPVIIKCRARKNQEGEDLVTVNFQMTKIRYNDKIAVWSCYNYILTNDR